MVRQNPKSQVLKGVPHVQWPSHHRSPYPATAVISHCSLLLESPMQVCVEPDAWSGWGFLRILLRNRKNATEVRAYQAGFDAKKSLVGSCSFATAEGRMNTKANLPQMHLSSLRDPIASVQGPATDFWRWGAIPQLSREITSAHFPWSALWNHCSVVPSGRSEVINSRSSFLHFYRRQTSVRD